MTQDSKNRTNTLTVRPPTTGSPPTLTVDWDQYGTYLEDSDLSDAEKRQFLEALWSIVVSFVDLGFGVHPVQQVGENSSDNSSEHSCAQNAQIRAFVSAERNPVVDSADIDNPQTERTDERERHVK